jgi:hypothetical protein
MRPGECRYVLPVISGNPYAIQNYSAPAIRDQYVESMLYEEKNLSCPDHIANKFLDFFGAGERGHNQLSIYTGHLGPHSGT